MSYRGYTAVITGAASGIGKAIAERCCLEGMNVALVDIDAKSLDQLTKQLRHDNPKLTIEPFVCDCSNYDAIVELVSSFKSRFNQNNIEMLFNNVGISSFTTIMDGDLKRLHRQMNINVWSVVYLTQLFLPLLQSSDNRNDCFIVNTGSVACMQSADSFYGVTKQAVLGVSETFDRELTFYFKKMIKKSQNSKNSKNIIKRRNIFVCTLCPGFVRTNMIDTSQREMKRANKDNNSGLGDLINDPNAANGLLRTAEVPFKHYFDKWAKEADYVAKVLFDGLKEKKFLVYPHQEWMDAMINDRTKSLKLQQPNDFKEFARVLKYGSKL